MIKKLMSNLKCYRVENGSRDEDRGKGKGKDKDENKGPLNFVFLHGYGANGRDLVNLSQQEDLKALNANWYFFEAPLSPPELAMFGGRAWFNLTLLSLGGLEADGKDFYDQENQEIEDSFTQLKNSLWELNLNLENTLIGGFSQGAMMASKLFFESPKNYRGFISFSGAPIHRKKWNLKEVNPKQKVFLSHGIQDPVVPFQCAKDLDKEIEGFNKKTHWFNGQHEIPHQVLKDLAYFIV